MAGKHRKPEPPRPLIPTAAGATAAALMLTTTGTLPAIRVPVAEAAVVAHPEHRVPRPRPVMMLAPPVLAPASVELAPGPPRVWPVPQTVPAPAALPKPAVVARTAVVAQPQPRQRTPRAVTRPQSQTPVGRHRAPEPAQAPTPEVRAPAVSMASRAVAAAVSQVGSRYVWGGATPGSFDCSGLVMWAYRQAGISLPHNAAAQAGVGRLVGISQLQPGDLLFFYHPVDHVAMYVGNGQIAEASTFGVPVHVRPMYTDGLVEIRRLID